MLMNKLNKMKNLDICNVNNRFNQKIILLKMKINNIGN